MAERTTSLDIVKSDFQNAGWQVENVTRDSLIFVPTVKGQYIRCIDPRYDRKSPPEVLGPAVPGGVFGVAYLMDGRLGESFADKVGRATSKVIESGYKPASHGDFTNGEIRGCKMLFALINGLLKENISEDEIRRLIDENDIHQTMLNGKAKPDGFAIHNEPGFALLPQRAMYVTNISYLDELGLNARTYSPKLVEIGELVTIKENRRIILPEAA